MELTIISTNYLSNNYLEYNYKRISKYINAKWIIVDNSPTKEEINFEHISLPKINIKEKSNSKLNPPINIHSYQHAAALDSAIPHIDTRYVMFLDPDFFITQDINVVLEYMDINNIQVFGSPYCKTENFKKIMDVPVAFNMIVDTKLVDICSWSFKPTGIESDGLFGDTGIAIYKYIKQNCKYECTIPKKMLYESYFWKNQLFGIHQHAKIRHDNDNKIKLLSIIESYIEKLND